MSLDPSGTQLSDTNRGKDALKNQRMAWMGMRVQTHPATDAWMQGDRYGNVCGVGPLWVSVKMDRSGRVRRFSRRNLLVVR